MPGGPNMQISPIVQEYVKMQVAGLADQVKQFVAQQIKEAESAQEKPEPAQAPVTIHQNNAPGTSSSGS